MWFRAQLLHKTLLEKLRSSQDLLSLLFFLHPLSFLEFSKCSPLGNTTPKPSLGADNGFTEDYSLMFSR